MAHTGCVLLPAFTRLGHEFRSLLGEQNKLSSDRVFSVRKQVQYKYSERTARADNFVKVLICFEIL